MVYRILMFMWSFGPLVMLRLFGDLHPGIFLHMSQGRDSFTRDYAGIRRGPYERASRLHIWIFDHGSYVFRIAKQTSPKRRSV